MNVEKKLRRAIDRETSERLRQLADEILEDNPNLKGVVVFCSTPSVRFVPDKSSA